MPSGSAWPSRAFPKSIGGVGEPLRHNQPSGPSEFELGRGLPQELGRASIMEESSVLRIADGQQDVRSAAQPRAARRSQVGCGALGAAARGASCAAARWHLLLRSARA